MPRAPAVWDHSMVESRARRAGLVRSAWHSGLWYREVNSYAEARSIVGHLDMRAVELDNGGHEAEAESVPGTPSAAFQAVKPPEHVLSLLDRNPRSPIRDRQNGTAGATKHRYRNLLPPM